MAPKKGTKRYRLTRTSAGIRASSRCRPLLNRRGWGVATREAAYDKCKKKWIGKFMSGRAPLRRRRRK